MIGNFTNPGAKWDRQPQFVKDHDFRSGAKALATPRGIYDLQANRGSVFVGIRHDTPDFAVDTIAQWWQYEGRLRYPQAHEIFILADAGGSNGWPCRAWKKALQDRICDPLGLAVTVSHYPPGTSKWNPIEHRLFSKISKNWAGQPPRYQRLCDSRKLRHRSQDLGPANAPDQPDQTRHARSLELPPAPGLECELIIGPPLRISDLHVCLLLARSRAEHAASASLCGWSSFFS